MDTLLSLLKKNARLSNKELATLLGKTEEQIEAKIAEYEINGIIKGYTVIVDDEKADKDTVTAYIELNITPQAESGFDKIAETIATYDEVESVTLMSGAYDLGVTVSGSNLKEISLFVSQRLSTIAGVLSTRTHFTLKTYKELGIMISDEAADERGFVSP